MTNTKCYLIHFKNTDDENDSEWFYLVNEETWSWVFDNGPLTNKTRFSDRAIEHSLDVDPDEPDGVVAFSRIFERATAEERAEVVDANYGETFYSQTDLDSFVRDNHMEIVDTFEGEFTD